MPSRDPDSAPGPARAGDRPHKLPQPMGHGLLRPKRAMLPHPLVTVTGLIIALVIFRIGSAMDYAGRLRYLPIAIGFVIVFAFISRRSARRQHQRRLQELEKLRNEPVWGLDRDPD